MTGDKGIALIEVIVVVTIISIILLIPILDKDILLNYREKKELIEFKNDINYARNRAIIESKRYIVDVRPYSNSYVIYKLEDSRNIVKKKIFENGIIIYKNNIDGYEIEFTHSGAPLKAGTIELKNSKGNKIELTITPAVGKVNIYFN